MIEVCAYQSKDLYPGDVLVEKTNNTFPDEPNGGGKGDSAVGFSLALFKVLMCKFSMIK